MILTIISITVLVIGICLTLCFRKFYVSDFLDPVGFYSTIFGAIAVAIAVVFILIGHCNTDVKIYTKQLERKAIVSQLELTPSGYENTSKIELIQKVSEWNQEVYSAKYWSENPWTNWFWSKKYVDSLEYIDTDM